MGGKYYSQIRDILHFGIQFVQKLWRKRLDTLCESGIGSVVLQLCCLPLGPLMLKNFEKSVVKQC
jgi:hypothetical protein